MADNTLSNKRDFIFCLLILAGIYACGTLLYYSQTFLLMEFYDNSIIKEMLSGWNYLAQAAGICLYIALYKYANGISGKRKVQVSLSLSLPVIMAISIFTTEGVVLILMSVFLNVIVGIMTAYGFTLIAVYIKKGAMAICFAGAYSIGGIITCLICRVNEAIMTSFYVIIFACLFVGIISALILLFKDIPAPSMENQYKEAEHTGIRKKDICIFHLVIALMAMIFALGANDPILIDSGNMLDMLLTRIFYAGGLLLAAIIFDKNHLIGSICTLASILYPIMIIILYKELPIHFVAVALIDTFSGFYAVYRAGIYMFVASEKNKLHMAALGLVVSRVVEGIMTVVIAFVGFDRLTSFVAAGVLFVPLIILFCYLLAKYGGHENTPAFQEGIVLESMTISSFAEYYHLTRREEEISAYLAENKTNGEIADILCLSESTVRFHVSNILKKTGMKNRNEVGRKYNERLLKGNQHPVRERED